MSLLSSRALDAARDGFRARLARAGDAGRDIPARLEALEASSPDTAEALRWLYAASPLSDWSNYDFGLFQACAAHGAFLRERWPLARGLPEDIFLHYVLHVRVNDEELCECRRLFYDRLAPRLRGLAPREAAIECNYWCAEQAAYRSTDERTRSALAVWRSGFGRCGEESVFAVNALRSVGIPARQVYTPRWSHCDDNHAWVEVWVEGGWHFLGACEPEEVLDRGWFTNAASRAMVIHSRRFGPSGSDEEVISLSGAAAYLNHLPRYAEARTLTVRVTGPDGAPAAGAEVAFGVLNMSEVYPAAVVPAAADGTARLTCGLGSLLVRARKDGAACERLVHTADVGEVELVLGRDAPAPDVWEDFAFLAPRDRPSPFPGPTEAQRALGREKAAAAAAKRAARAPRLPAFSPEEASVLSALPPKDRLDADAAALREALETSRGYEGCGELFRPYVLCPRVADEPLRENRRSILARFSPEQRGLFREDPRRLWEFIESHIGAAPALEYDALVTLPAAALASRTAGPLSRRVLFVSACRALGVPARLHPADGAAEYWDGGGFRAVDAPPADCAVTLECPAGWQYGADYAVAVLEEGAYRTLRLSGPSFPARPGAYRVLTSNRLPNGDLFASRYHFRLAPGERRTVRLRKYQADLPRMLGSYDLEEFTASTPDGHTVPGSALARGGAVLLWLEEGAEPTEHILDELLARREDFLRLPADIVFLVRGPAALKDPKLRQVLAALPEARVYFDGPAPSAEAVARRVYVDHEKLPLAVVTTKPLHAVYASSGYNVGSGDMILRVLRVCGIAQDGDLL